MKAVSDASGTAFLKFVMCKMGDVIFAGVLGLAAIAAFVFSVRSFREKGFLLNNAFIYASPQEREKLDKKPYYRQSAVVFLLIGVILAVNAADVLLKTGWLFYVVMGLAGVAIIYAIVSTVIIMKSEKSK